MRAARRRDALFGHMPRRHCAIRSAPRVSRRPPAPLFLEALFSFRLHAAAPPRPPYISRRWHISTPAMMTRCDGWHRSRIMLGRAERLDDFTISRTCRHARVDDTALLRRCPQRDDLARCHFAIARARKTDAKSICRLVPLMAYRPHSAFAPSRDKRKIGGRSTRRHWFGMRLERLHTSSDEVSAHYISFQSRSRVQQKAAAERSAPDG